MFNFKSAALISALFLFGKLSAQTPQQFILWNRIQFQIQPAKGWLLILESEDRRFPDKWTQQQTMIRTGCRKVLWKGLDVYAGFAAFENGANFSDKPATSYITEIRPETGIGYSHSYKRWGFYHRVRGEFRLQQATTKEPFGDHFLFFGRLRYQWSVTFVATDGKSKVPRIWLKANAEPMMNLGKQIKGNLFDQMRAYLGVEIEVVKNLLSLEPAYLFIYQKRLNADEFFYRHILRTSVYMKLYTHHKK